MKLLLLILFFIHHGECNNACHHPTVNLTSTSIHQDDSFHSRIKRSPQNIRISRFYDSSYTSMNNSDDITKNILDPAVDFWQKALMVNNPLTSPLIIDRACADTYSYATVGNNKLKVCTTSCAAKQLCYNTPIPDQYLQSCYTKNADGGYTTTGTTGSGSGNTDLLLIVTQLASGCSTNTLAYAVACELENKFDRPVMGLINICPGKINSGPRQNMAINTLKHEITHVLGMSSNLFAFWRDQTGSPLTPRDKGGFPSLGLKTVGSTSVMQYSNSTVREYVKTYIYPTGPVSKTVSFIVTPTVQAEMRNYFNCSTIEGMILEDYGAASSALSHFKKLYLQNELMTAAIAVNSQTSRLTLAVLQDTGWYIPNYNYAENFTYGKNLGCNFVTKGCYEYMNTMQAAAQSISPYCNQTVTSSGLSCTPDLMSQQFCNLYDSSTQATSIPAQFKYFKNQNWVSLDPYSDYCPVLMVYLFTNSDNFYYTGECLYSLNSVVQGTTSDYFNQGFGPTSMCVGFDRSIPWYYDSCDKRYTPSIQGAACYQYECTQNYGLVIVVNGFKYQCTAVNQIIDVTSKNTYLIPHGKLVCPDCRSVCNSTICNSVNAILAPQCNNVDRLCPGEMAYSIPCSTTILKILLAQQVMIICVFFLLKA